MRLLLGAVLWLLIAAASAWSAGLASGPAAPLDPASRSPVPAPGRTVPAPTPDRPLPLHRGINLTGWFRYPATTSPGALRAWLGEDALLALRHAGFDFVRLAVDPSLLNVPGLDTSLTEAIGRLHRGGLTVFVSVHPQGWRLEAEDADRARLFATWRRLASLLQRIDPSRTVAELLNEPVFPNDPAAWQALQHRLLLQVRSSLPLHTILLTGNDWSSAKGLAAMVPERDPNVIYGFHLYEPPELTSLAAWRPGLDRVALARLPFPVTDEAACRATAAGTDSETAGVIRFYCTQHWDVGRVGEVMSAAARWSRDHNVPVVLGEFGASAALNAPARLAWLRTVRYAAERSGMGWALWGYDDVMGLNVPRPPGRRPTLPPAVLAALGLQS